MDAAKVEVALVRYVGDVGRYVPVLAQLPYDGGGCWVVDGDQHHGGSVEVGGLEQAVAVLDLSLGDAEAHLVIQTGIRADDGDSGIGIEAVEDASGGNLGTVPAISLGVWGEA